MRIATRLLVLGGVAVLTLGISVSLLRSQDRTRGLFPPAPPRKPSGSLPGDGIRRTNSDLDASARLAVRAGLDFLARRQNADGSWTEVIGRKVHYAYKGEKGEHVGVTALACMAFLANGSSPGRGPYAENIERGLDFILKHTASNGFITAHESRMYSHAFATLFLAEIYGETGLVRVKETLKRAVSLIVQAQNDEGGWRYQPLARDADMSITVCQVMALRAARNAGIQGTKSAIDRAIHYVKGSFLPTGAFLYQHENIPGQRSRVSFPLTAAGVTALYGAGEYDSEEITRGLSYMWQNRFRRSRARNSFDYYYGMYYATQAAFQRGGDYWDDWYQYLWPDLLDLQDPVTGSWQDLVGPNYATAMACVILQIPYYYLPIFER